MSDSNSHSIFEIAPDTAEEARLDAIAEAEIAAGKGVPQDRVAAWLRQLAAGEDIPPPTA